MSARIAFLWSEPDGRVSDSWHDGGSVLIIAATVEDARAAWDAHWRALKPYYDADGKHWTAAVAGAPDRAWPIAGGAEPEVLVFPNAGCC